MATKEQSLSDLVFVPYKIISRETAFNSTFSEVQIGIEPFKKPSTDLSIGFEFPSFFLQDEDEEKKCPKVDCILSGALESEASMFHNVMTDFVQELGRVTLNRDYESGPARLRDYQRFFSDDYTPRGITDTSASGRVMYGPIGIGERGVWWGEPDACVRPLNSDDHDPSDSTVFVATSSEAESDSESSQFKAKQEIERSHLPQAIAIAIVHSFTQSNRHPMLNPMVPTILMNGYKFQIILYDCHNDVLLVSTTVEYKINDRITTLGTQILWNIINHRYLCVCVSTL